LCAKAWFSKNKDNVSMALPINTIIWTLLVTKLLLLLLSGFTVSSIEGLSATPAAAFGS